MNQATQGEHLDLALLDSRVESWKEHLDLLNEVPPVNFKIEENGIKFHDRSHILVQDYLGLDSVTLAKRFNEPGLPSIYEEILSVFCAQLTHEPTVDAESFCLPGVVNHTIRLLHRIGYIEAGTFFLTSIDRISTEVSETLLEIIVRSDFETFRTTLVTAASDCENWDNVRVRG